MTCYGFDDNHDGNPTYLGTGIISNATLHGFANEDLGTYQRPGTLATDANFVTPGTKVYVPTLERYYVMEDTRVECTEDWLQSKPHVDLYVSGTGPETCNMRGPADHGEYKDHYRPPPPDLPVKAGSACHGGVGR
jgi:hypothetical protein